MINSGKPILDNVITEALTVYGNIFYIVATLGQIGLKVESESDEPEDADISYLLNDSASSTLSIVYLLLMRNGIIDSKYGEIHEQIDKVTDTINEYCANHIKSDFDADELLQDIEDKLNEE